MVDTSLTGLDFIKSLTSYMEAKAGVSGSASKYSPLGYGIGITKLENSKDFFSAQKNLKAVFANIAAERNSYSSQRNWYDMSNRFSYSKTSSFRTNSFYQRQSNPYKLMNNFNRYSSRGQYSMFSTSIYKYSNPYASYRTSWYA